MNHFVKIMAAIAAAALLAGTASAGAARAGAVSGEIASGTAQVQKFDLAVTGAGLGGIAAAIQAAREGLSVVLIEPSPNIGGQIAAAVATMDDVGRTRWGIYGEFIERVRAHYAGSGTASNICLWGSDTIAAEPAVASRIFLDMLSEAGCRQIYTSAKIERVRADEGAIRGVTLTAGSSLAGTAPPDGPFELEACVFIDATETGDFSALCGAEYRIGNSRSTAVNLGANIQDITYSAVIRRYEGGPPKGLLLLSDPPGYDKYLPKFRRVVASGGSRWGSGGGYPFDAPTHNAYRALPDESSPHRGDIDGGDASTWDLITRTSINWANDYPGRGKNAPGLTARYIEDPEYRARVDRAAMLETLCFIRYMQTELGMGDWSVDSSQGFGGYAGGVLGPAGEDGEVIEVPAEFEPVLRHFPPFPYVREARRIVGAETLAADGAERDKARGRAIKDCPSSVALGEYPADIHGSTQDLWLERDLGETNERYPIVWDGGLGVFGVPMNALIPARLDGLIAAEKNISVSRMVNGAIRLHPIVMHTGQAAGALAAAAARDGVRPRDVRTADVQRALIRAGCQIALDICGDAPLGTRLNEAVQWASLSGAMERIKVSRSFFGAALPIRRGELLRMLRAAGADEAAHRLAPMFDDRGFIDSARFRKALGLAPGERGDLALTRGEAAGACAALAGF